MAASGGLPPSAPQGQSAPTGKAAGRDRLLLALLGVLLLAALGVAVARGAQAYHAFQRLRAAESAPAPVGQPRVHVQDWMPLALVARANHVPVETLLSALRAAGFTADPQAVAPDVPGALRQELGRRLGQAGDAGDAGGAAARHRLERRPPLPPERQSLRQIAEASGRSPDDAVRVAEDAIREYRLSHAPHPPSSPAAPAPPAAR